MGDPILFSHREATPLGARGFLLAMTSKGMGLVDIRYAADGVEPPVTTKVPLPVVVNQSESQRIAEALRSAPKLTHHARAAIELQPDPSEGLREIIEGVAEGLGMLSPATKLRPPWRS